MGVLFYMNLANTALGGVLIGCSLITGIRWAFLLGTAVLCWGLVYVMGAVE